MEDEKVIDCLLRQSESFFFIREAIMGYKVSLQTTGLDIRGAAFKFSLAHPKPK